METEVFFNGDAAVMKELWSILVNAEATLQMERGTVKASGDVPQRHTQTVSGKAIDLAKAIVELFNKTTDIEAEVRFGNRTTIITRQDSEGTIEKTITQDKGAWVVFHRKA